MNGTEIGRVNAGTAHARVPFDAVAQTVCPEPYPLCRIVVPKGLLRLGRNVLSIQVLNSAVDDLDAFILPRLVIRPRRLREAEWLVSSRSALETVRHRNVLAYLDARLAFEAGDIDVAVRELQSLILSGESEEAPYLRLAEVLRAAGNAAEARRVLQDSLALGIAETPRTATALAALELVDGRIGLDAAAAKIGDLSSSLKETGDVPPRSVLLVKRAAEELSWLARRFAADGVARINCGSTHDTVTDGITWHRDRFFYQGGFNVDATPVRGQLGESSPYLRERSFVEPNSDFGYRVPLPPGRYELTLHFGEIFHSPPTYREFQVVVEGAPLFPSAYRPMRGQVDRVKRVIEVADGLLEISFLALTHDPAILALEITPVSTPR